MQVIKFPVAGGRNIFSQRGTADNPFLREMVIPFGSVDYVASFEIEDNATDTILTIRHQREEDDF